jgi:hypothetical protein
MSQYITTGTTSTGTGITSSNYAVWATGTAGGTSSLTTASVSDYDTRQIVVREAHNIAFPSGVKFKKINSQTCKLEFPDGSVLNVDDKGNYHIDDKNAKVTYKANTIREFNRYINASDLLEEFIRFLGTEFDVRQNQIMDVPINVFIEWLIVQAAMKDGDDYGKDMKLLELEVQKERNWYRRCKCCGRYIQKRMFEAGLLFCNSMCFDKYQLRLG